MSPGTSKQFTSSQSRSILDYFPPTVAPLVELTRIQSFVVGLFYFWPCAWGLMLAGIEKQVPVITLAKATVAYFLAASYLFRSVACIWDDIIDKDLDAKVERTKGRPLPSGRLSVFAALWLLFFHVVLMMATMFLYTNPLAFKLGTFGIFFWVFLYPFMKRITHWPQAFLGFLMNWGLLVAYATITGNINYNTVGIFLLGTACWTVHYDTIYGMMDKKDDVHAGIKSTTLLFGSSVRIILCAFDLCFLAALWKCGVNLNAPILYYILAVGGTALHLSWQLLTVDFESKESNLKMFKSNAGELGYFVYFGLVAVYLSKV